MHTRCKWSLLCVLGLALSGEIAAQDTYKFPGCSDVTRTNFTKVTVVNKAKDPTLDEIIRFVVAKDGSVYFNERGGTLKVVKPNGQILKLGKIDVYPPSDPLKMPRTSLQGNHNNEFGLVGLALDPDFESNHHIYVNYQSHTAPVSNLSRWTLNNDQLDMASEKVILSWPVQQDFCCHTGGDIRFDAKGDLWMSIGNNTLNANNDNDSTAYVNEAVINGEGDDQAHAANTNDLRGKIIRIHPAADGGYTVPSGNLKDVYASLYSASDLAKIRPEIYTMGHRNPYTISVDDVKGLLMWGDVGPDNGWDTEEYNMVSKPGNMGWPYFAGAEGNAHYRYKLNKDPAGPLNTSKWNTGVRKLPPAIGATIGYRRSCAITGPLFRWTAAQTNPKKLPPHFDGKWFVMDWNSGSFQTVTMDSTYSKVIAQNKFYTGLVRPLESYIAPDGVLYVMEYGTGSKFQEGTVPVGTGADNTTAISRLEYTGPACTEAVSLKDQTFMESAAGKTRLINLGAEQGRTVGLPFGAKGFRLYDLSGKLAWQFRAASPSMEYHTEIAVPDAVGNGIYRAKYSF